MTELSPTALGSVIKGFDEVVLGMRVGGRRYAVLPSEIGYGAAGQSSFGIKVRVHGNAGP